MDALLVLSDPAHPKEPEWPKADFIVGNPPFLGGKLIRNGLGDAYVDALFDVWSDRVPRESDLCCYWFEKARHAIELNRTSRAGLLATQGIRGGANRRVLERIKSTGELFFAISDREWILDGAAVHVSIVGFSDKQVKSRHLDGVQVQTINSNLTATADVTESRKIAANLGMSFMGDTKGGLFDIPDSLAREMLAAPNPHGRPNSDVVVPWSNGLDVTRRNRRFWIVDFGVDMAIVNAAHYAVPFAHVEKHVFPQRQTNKRESYKAKWWLHVEPRPAMRRSMVGLSRFAVTIGVGKHRIFVWMAAPTLPDHQLFVFMNSEDHFLGILHSRVHEVWARSQGTQVRERESGFRYTATTCFETFPIAESDESLKPVIGQATKELDTLRLNWLNPPEWTREEVLEFPGSVDGPWARYVVEPNARGIGTVRYPRLVPKDEDAAKALAKRTLTNLYNERPTWLDLAHKKLDEAVFAAYGWSPDLSDDELLAKLLALNLERATAE